MAKLPKKTPYLVTKGGPTGLPAERERSTSPEVLNVFVFALDDNGQSATTALKLNLKR